MQTCDDAAVCRKNEGGDTTATTQCSLLSREGGEVKGTKRDTWHDGIQELHGIGIGIGASAEAATASGRPSARLFSVLYRLPVLTLNRNEMQNGTEGPRSQASVHISLPWPSHHGLVQGQRSN